MRLLIPKITIWGIHGFRCEILEVLVVIVVYRVLCDRNHYILLDLISGYGLLPTQFNHLFKGLSAMTFLTFFYVPSFSAPRICWSVHQIWIIMFALLIYLRKWEVEAIIILLLLPILVFWLCLFLLIKKIWILIIVIIINSFALFWIQVLSCNRWKGLFSDCEVFYFRLMRKWLIIINVLYSQDIFLFL
jgi:hypothetical protein